MNGSSSLTGTPAQARRPGKPSPSNPDGAVVRRRTARNLVSGPSRGSRGRTSTSSTVMAGISGLPDLVEHCGDHTELILVQPVDETVPNGDEMQRSGRFQGR